MSEFEAKRSGDGPGGEGSGEGSGGEGLWPGLLRKLRAAREIYEGVYLAPYRSEVHREYLRQRDLFLLLAFSDLLGVPNPVQFYTLELYPELIEGFHEWHLRMGMDRPPEGGFRCC